jgi:hypothetical protein
MRSGYTTSRPSRSPNGAAEKKENDAPGKAIEPLIKEGWKGRHEVDLGRGNAEVCRERTPRPDPARMSGKANRQATRPTIQAESEVVECGDF